MYSTYHKHSSYINVPNRLSKKARKDKSKWDLLVLAICLKLQSTSSGMYVHTPYDLMKAFHCGHSKATRMFLQLDKSNLFRYNAKTHFLSAKCFKIGADWYEDKHGKRYYHDSVIVIEKAKDGTISHYDISVQLRDKMMMRMISAKSSSDELLHVNQYRRPEARKPLTHKFIANVAGVSRSTATRHLNKLANGDNKLMNVTTHDKIPVYDMKHGVVINEIPNRVPFVSGQYTYVRDANDYTILDKNYYKQFKHIIYNHRGRKTDNRVIKNHWDL